jgi:hypothetical protein
MGPSSSNNNHRGLILKYFPEEYIQLNREVEHHPALMTLLQNHPVEEFEIRMAEIATYCQVILDGEYMESDLVKLAKILERRLYNMRPAKTGIILL